MRMLLQPWLHNRKSIYHGIQINQRLIERGFTWDDVQKWLNENPTDNDETKEFLERVKKSRKPSKECPKCGGLLKLFNKVWKHCGGCGKNSCNYEEIIDGEKSGTTQ